MSRGVSIRIMQDGLKVAAVFSLGRETAEFEAVHYACVYAQDGPVQVFEGRKRRTDLEPAPPREEGDASGGRG